MTDVGLFPIEQVEHLRTKMPELAFRVLMGSLNMLEAIVSDAQQRKLFHFAISISYGKSGSTVEMRFHDFDGNLMRRSVSFRHEWEKQGGEYYGVDEAILMSSFVESLILSVPGMTAATRLHKNLHKAERRNTGGMI